MSLLYRSGQLAQRSKGQDPGILPSPPRSPPRNGDVDGWKGLEGHIGGIGTLPAPWMAWPRASNGWLWCV